ncbi:MAG: UvrD-helicase domain-containing protein [Bergeyella sp.]
MEKQYTVINASAGSGKTYALVQRLLMICLRYPNQPDAIRNILALTFTNKAANEMKERILSWLKAFSDEKQYEYNTDLINIQNKLNEQGIKVTLKDLHERSKKVLDYVLHHYSTLNIGTIDKFNSRLVRSFSYELGLAQNFNLEIQSEPFLIEAVDKMLDEIGEKQDISEAFMDFVNYSLDNNERVNLNQALYNSAKEFVQDKHYFNLSENKDFTWDAYEESKQKLRQELRDLKKENTETAKNIISLLHEKNLETSDFAGGSVNGIAKFFFEAEKYYNKERRDFPFPSNEEKALEKFQNGASANSKKREDEILEILDYLLENRRKIISNYILSQKKEKILKAILPLKVNKEVQDKLAEIEKENDLVLLSKFNIMIHENLRDEPSSFIYEKVGTQFSHYFFDEFQDTSQLQWQNFLPLRDHTIHSENMSFTLVGDPKQSIYRFRGGDSKMMLDIIQHKENSPVKAFVEPLDTNWRSAKNIVQFNNEYYDFLSGFVNEEHRDIFGKGAQQKANSGFDGRMKIHLMENASKQIFYEETAEKMRQDIQECVENGFRFSDITVLCRGNFDIFSYSRLLNNMKVNYNEAETYIKTISDKGLTLELSPTILAVTEFLRWKLNPKNLQNLVKTLYYLNASGRISIGDFTAETLEILNETSTETIETKIREKYHVQLIQTDIPHLNLYNYIEYFVQEFSVSGKETDFLLNFLEMLYNFSQNTGFTLKDFIKYWDEEGRSLSIQTSENIDAVQIMTIHKAKGLEFPVVFLPMENSHKDGSFSGWIPAQEEHLNSVIISPFERVLENYDEEMQRFNETHIYENKIDRYCLQYVATTRAVEQMFFYLEKPNKSSNNLELYEFAENIQKRKFPDTAEMPDSFDVFEADENILKKQKAKEKTPVVTQSIETLGSSEKSSEIKIATPSKNYQQRKQSVREGIFTHEVLSKINTEADVEKVLRNYLLSGMIAADEKEQIAKRILDVIRDDRYSGYFKEGLKVFNEQELMVSEKIYRPDRMIQTDEGWIILDFKTGAERDKYEKQMELYRNALENSGRKVVKTELIYL